MRLSLNDKIIQIVEPRRTASVIFNDFKACEEFDIRNRLHRIRAPTLIYCGTDEKVTPIKFSTYLLANIASSRLVAIPEAVHMAMIERPGVVNQEIGNSLGQSQ
jgi:pimeloyl-ACP methyl ester carboxylesterase